LICVRVMDAMGDDPPDRPTFKRELAANRQEVLD
jgi:hypothetical protein